MRSLFDYFQTARLGYFKSKFACLLALLKRCCQRTDTANRVSLISAEWRIYASVNYGHYNDVIMSVMVSQITSLTTVYSTVYIDADHRKHQSSTSLAFVRGIHRWPVNSPHKGLIARKMFSFDDVIMASLIQIRTRRLLGANPYANQFWFIFNQTLM